MAEQRTNAGLAVHRALLAPVTADLCSTASDVKPALSEIVGTTAAASAAGRDSASARSSSTEPIAEPPIVGPE